MAEYVVEFGKDGRPVEPGGRLDAAAFHRNHQAIWAVLEMYSNYITYAGLQARLPRKAPPAQRVFRGSGGIAAAGAASRENPPKAPFHLASCANSAQ